VKIVPIERNDIMISIKRISQQIKNHGVLDKLVKLPKVHAQVIIWSRIRSAQTWNPSSTLYYLEHKSCAREK